MVYHLEFLNRIPPYPDRSESMIGEDVSLLSYLMHQTAGDYFRVILCMNDVKFTDSGETGSRETQVPNEWDVVGRELEFEPDLG
jgi:hypothetical protein